MAHVRVHCACSLAASVSYRLKVCSSVRVCVCAFIYTLVSDLRACDCWLRALWCVLIRVKILRGPKYEYYSYLNYIENNLYLFLLIFIYINFSPGASIITKLFMNPIDVAKTRLQTQDVTSLQVRMYACVNACVHTCCVCVRVCVFARLWVHVYTCVFVCVHLCGFIFAMWSR